jgi:hypothetical protein
VATREVHAGRIAHHLKESIRHHHAARQRNYQAALDAIAQLQADMPQSAPPKEKERP